jgi:hypothetical protein
MASPQTAKRRNGWQAVSGGGGSGSWRLALLWRLCKSIFNSGLAALALHEGESENRSISESGSAAAAASAKLRKRRWRGETAGGSGSAKAIISQQHRAAS